MAIGADVPSLPITIDDYWALVLEDDGAPLSTELVDGIVVVTPPPGGPHQRAVLRLAMALSAACPAGFQVLPGVGWVVEAAPRPTVRVPDIVVVADGEATALRLTSPPLLAVEVAASRSSLERDLVTKRREYAAAGCGHYWVLLPDAPELVRFRLDDDAFAEIGRHRGAIRVDLVEPFAVTIDLALLAPPG